MAVLINTDNFIGNGCKIGARDWTQCPDVHFQVCLFFSHPVAFIWKLVKKYVCFHVTHIIFVPLCFSGLCTVLSVFKLPANIYSFFLY